MSLGRLLLKGFGRKPKKPKKAPQRARRRAPARSRALVPAPAPVAEPLRETPQQLTTSQMIRPNEALRASIEGFLLDLRSEHTRTAYAKDLKRFVKFLLARDFEKGPAALDRNILISYKDSLLLEGLQHTTIDRHLATLKSFFGWLAEEGAISKSPAEAVRFLHPKRISRTQAFTDDEVARILELPDLHTRTGALHSAILSVLFHCGLRRSELCSLKTNSLASERGHWLLRLTGKGNTERIIPLVPAVKAALDHHMKMSRIDAKLEQPLFAPIRNNRTGILSKSLDPSMVFYIVRKYAKSAGIVRRVSPHSCRATAISHARDKDVPDRSIQEFAGWASTDMITRYDKRKVAIEKSAAHAIRYEREKK